jgi:hypothetical protein
VGEFTMDIELLQAKIARLEADLAEFLINDRLSFMRFLGLGLTRCRRRRPTEPSASG